jgi:hypothetical protein
MLLKQRADDSAAEVKRSREELQLAQVARTQAEEGKAEGELSPHTLPFSFSDNCVSDPLSIF